MNVGFSELVVPAGLNPGVGFSVSVGQSPLGPPFGTFAPRLLKQPGDLLSEIPVANPGPNNTTTYNFYSFSAYNTEGAGVYRVVGQTQGGPVWITGGRFFGYGSHPSDMKIGIKPSKCDPVGQAFKHLEP